MTSPLQKSAGGEAPQGFLRWMVLASFATVFAIFAFQIDRSGEADDIITSSCYDYMHENHNLPR